MIGSIMDVSHSRNRRGFSADAKAGPADRVDARFYSRAFCRGKPTGFARKSPWLTLP
jgi:hypothetical protein